MSQTAAEACDRAMQCGIEFLRRSQRPNGEFTTLSGPDPTLQVDASRDPSLFTTMHVANSLRSVASENARDIVARACTFLFSQMLPGGLWRFWTHEHPGSAGMPPDVDDSACVAHLLGMSGFTVPDNTHLLEANRDRRGLFYTWILPRFPHLQLPEGRRFAWQSLGKWRRTAAFFRSGKDRPERNGVDAVVNANALLACRRPDVATPVAAWLGDILLSGRAAAADRWYQSEIALLYAVARGMESGVGALAALRPLLAARLAAIHGLPDSSLECAELLTVTTIMREPGELAERCVAALLAAQRADGSWPARVHYYGGFRRARAWGSAELSTGFCVEAIARFAKLHG